MKTITMITHKGKPVFAAVAALAIALPLLLTGKSILAAEESKKGEIYPQSDSGIVVTGNMDPVTFGQDGPRPKVTVDGQVLEVENYYYSAIDSAIMSSRLTGTVSGWYEVLLVFNHRDDLTDRFDNDVENFTCTVKALGKFYVEPISIDKCEIKVPDTLDLEHPLSDIKVIYNFDSVNRAYVDPKDITITATGDVKKGTNLLEVSINNDKSFAFGSRTIEADVDPIELTADIIEESTKGDVYNCTFSGRPCEPTKTIHIKSGDKTYRSDKIGIDVSYENNINVGTAFLKVKGNVITTGEVKIPFQVLPKDINKCYVNITTFFVYDGKAHDLGIKIKTPLGTELTDKDFKVECDDLVNPGKHTAKIIGTNNLTGTKEVQIEIADLRRPSVVTPVPTVTDVPEVTKEPVVTAAPTSAQITKPATPTAKPSVTEVPVVTEVPSSDPKEQIFAFVDRIYTQVLGRDPEEQGSKFWSEELYKFTYSGADVAQMFIFSDEFENRDTTDEEFVKILYETFFDREPEENGFKFWTSALKEGGLDRTAVANGFIYSQEWADTCAKYGIRSGGIIKPSVEIEPSSATYAFVERMYTTAMNRESDKEGSKFWSDELSNFRFTGEQVGAMFFLSDEMNGFGLSDEEFVTRLYKTFMDRDPEEGGFKFWVSYLADGGSREGAVYGFTRSEEFVNKCVEARILPY